MRMSSNPPTRIWKAVSTVSRGDTFLSLFQDIEAVLALSGTGHAFKVGTFRVVLSVFAPLTGVLLTLSLRPQCSHSIQIRVER